MKDIKALQIQGARRVAAATARALVLGVTKNKTKNKTVLMRDTEKLANKLAKLRATEPMVRNTLRYFMARIEQGKSVEEIKNIALETKDQYDKEFTESFKRITKYGAELIPKNATVLTHCHSTTVNAILALTKKKKKKIKVYATETRPRYQGRSTAKHLASAGVDVTIMVDSAANSVLKKADLVMVGCDAINSKGDLYNKIGTSGIAMLAQRHTTPFYVATQLYKYDPISRWGQMTEIEQRPTEEVWKKKPRGVKILNPAFDITPRRFISAYITGAGIIPPGEVAHVASEEVKVRYR